MIKACLTVHVYQGRKTSLFYTNYLINTLILTSTEYLLMKIDCASLLHNILQDRNLHDSVPASSSISRNQHPQKNHKLLEIIMMMTYRIFIKKRFFSISLSQHAPVNLLEFYYLIDFSYSLRFFRLIFLKRDVNGNNKLCSLIIHAIDEINYHCRKKLYIQLKHARESILLIKHID